MRWMDWSQSRVYDARLAPSWALVYATVDAPIVPALRSLSARYRGLKVFGATSFQGVFSPRGFDRGVHILFGESTDEITVEPVLRATNAMRAKVEARSAASHIMAEIGRVDAMLLHATPGFEEHILEGIDEATGGTVPVFGGSAADDDLSGKWSVFSGLRVEQQGFVLVGFSSSRKIYGSFVAGYTPMAERGTVTSAQGRIVRTIDGQPAAAVYNRWTQGAIEQQLGGGIVLSPTSLRPLGRVVDKVGAVARYLLSHPHEVLPDGSLALFTDVAVGDELVLMLGTEGSLLDRTKQVAARALAGAEPDVRGGILVYCGGCVGALGSATGKVAATFTKGIGGAAFVGAATFGEQGCFPGPKPVNRHGNLMCDAMLFEA